ncbi:response regulator transcription factor [Archangium violaceum]|uniref:response regulator transcription factor n=1 Tax=Archangium violaceum TaxID=83451 RepID=UPI002B2E7436|nr:response regulator transcription factor [Archangium violaceum]
MPHILIVDDEPDLAELLAYNLGRAGFATTLAYTGEEALARVRTSAPDLILLDLMLPDIDGADLYRQLRADPATSHLRILVLSARPDAHSRVSGVEILLKPFKVQEVVARVSALVQVPAVLPEQVIFRAGTYPQVL